MSSKEKTVAGQQAYSPLIASTTASAPTPVVGSITPQVQTPESSPDGGARLSDASSGTILPNIKNRRSMVEIKTVASFKGFNTKSPIGKGAVLINDSDGFEVGSAPGADLFESNKTSGATLILPIRSSASTTPRELSTSSDVEYNHGLSAGIPTENYKKSGTVAVAQTDDVDHNTLHLDGGVDAQERWLAAFCIFVANLPEAVDDKTLHYEVELVMLRFGHCFVKIRRDPNNLPFAFCQYTTAEHAQTALEQVRGTIIKGRAVRTEFARGNRFFSVSLRNKLAIDKDVAVEQLEPFGKIASVNFMPAEHEGRFNIGPAVVIEFAFWSPDRDMNRAFRNDPIFVVKAYDPDRRRENNTRSDARIAALDQYHVNTRSIYVGNLHRNVSEGQLRTLFSSVGPVRDITIKHHNDNTRRVARSFAFVEFDSISLPQQAIEQLNGSIFFGTTLTIQLKKDRSDRTVRRHASANDIAPTTSAPRGNAEHTARVHTDSAVTQNTSVAGGIAVTQPQTPFDDPYVVGPMSAPAGAHGFAGHSMHPGGFMTYGHGALPYGFGGPSPAFTLPQHYLPSPGMLSPYSHGHGYIAGPFNGHYGFDQTAHYARPRVITTPSRMPHAYGGPGHEQHPATQQVPYPGMAHAHPQGNTENTYPGASHDHYNSR